MPTLQSRILERLGQTHFATSHQLATWCRVDARRISDAVQALLNVNLIDGSLITRPMILHLTPAGGRLLGKPLLSGRWQASWPVMAHYCHRNVAAEILAAQYGGFNFLSRQDLLKAGFNPGHGEHAAKDAAGKSWFVLLDDYLMGSERIKRAWTRRHVPNQKYWPDSTGRRMCDVAQGFLVVSTDEKNAEVHRARILKDQLPADVLTIKPLWKT